MQISIFPRFDKNSRKSSLYSKFISFKRLSMDVLGIEFQSCLGKSLLGVPSIQFPLLIQVYEPENVPPSWPLLSSLLILQAPPLIPEGGPLHPAEDARSGRAFNRQPSHGIPITNSNYPTDTENCVNVWETPLRKWLHFTLLDSRLSCKSQAG